MIDIKKNILDAIAIIGSMLGSVLIASNSSYVFLGYIFFLTANIATYMILSESNVRKSIIWLNIFYIGVNVLGIINYG